MSHQTVLLIMSCCATAHLVITAVMGLYARYQVKYLSITWIMGIFAAMIAVAAHFSIRAVPENLGILHPSLLLLLMAITYLQSIFPLSIPMPGYLQWGRMWKYALPAIVMLAIYGLGGLLGSSPVVITDLDDFAQHLLSGDVLLRLGILGICIYYILNIFRLPHRLTHVPFPRYLVGYSTVLGMSAIFYIIITIAYTPMLAMVYLLVFTILNLYLCFRTLESTALTLPRPVIEKVKKEPTAEEIVQAENDFNEANLQRFHRIEFWMQNHPESWKDYTFGRDKLCEETGLNRHLLLQCLRSQDYYNVHDYINSYRIAELKQQIANGSITSITECLKIGFGTTKTVRNCFQKHVGMSIDDFLAQYSRKSQ